LSATYYNQYHTYNTAGTYPVSVVITNDCGNDTTLLDTVVIDNTLPITESLYLNIPSNPTCPNQNLSFNTSSGYQNYNWDFGDGTTLSGSSYEYHTYTTGGTFPVSVTFENLCGTDTTLVDTIVIDNTIPITGSPYFNLNPNLACPTESVNFSTSFGMWYYVYDYGDGTNDSTNSSSSNHTYSSAGTYPVTVKLVNFCGNDSTLYDTVTIDNTLPVGGSPYLNVNNSPGCPGASFNLYAQGGHSAYVFDYGDGSPLDSSQNQWDYNKNHIYTTGGTFYVSVKIYNECGNDTVLYDSVIVDPTIPVADGYLNIYDSPSCPGEQVQFQSVYGYDDYYFDYGDGTTENATYYNQYHTYNVAGTYSVSVRITNVCGNDTTIYDSVVIDNTLPITGSLYLNMPIDPACPNSNLSFNTSYGYQNYSWDFGDGGTSTGSNSGYHTYTAAGTYTVTTTFENLCGSDTSLYDSLVIDPTIPVANGSLTVYSSPACPGEQIQFQSVYGYNDYYFNYGDGTTETATYYNQYHTYTSAGTYIVSVKITNDCGNDTTVYDSVVIDNTLPITGSLYLNMPIDPACPNSNLSFNTSYGYQNYSWDFGDGGTSSGSRYGYHTYTTAGTYTVTATFENQCGNDTSLYDSLVIDPTIPVANGSLTVYSSPACPGEQIQFQSVYGYNDYYFNYGDGTTETATYYNQYHTYSTAGTYIVSVKITNDCGNDTTVYDSVVIDNTLPITGGVYINMPSNPTCPNQSLSFYAPSGYQNYSWDFGDGGTSSGSSYASHTYTAGGIFTVSVTFENQCGNDTVLYDSLVIDPALPVTGNPYLNIYDSPDCLSAQVRLSAKYGYAAYVFDYGDGSALDSSLNQWQYNKYHVYNTAGTYYVSVRIYNNCGNDTVLYDSVVIHP